MNFTLFELKKLKEENEMINIEEQLITNSIMFKENLKLVSGQCIEMLWRKQVDL